MNRVPYSPAEVSGNCIPWNGYIPANRIKSYDANGKPNGVMGVPQDYRPAVQSLIPWPAVPDPKDPMYNYYGTNTVWVPLKNGVNHLFPGIRVWSLGASLVKNIPFEGRYNLRFQDFFNCPPQQPDRNRQ